MKAKIIEKLLWKKFCSWLDSIEDIELKNLLLKNTIITGGSIVSYLLNETPNDFDIYFKNKETTIKVAEYYVKKFKESYTYKSKYGHLVIGVIPSRDRVSIMVKSAGVISEDVDNSYQYFEMTPPDSPETSDYVEQLVTTLKDAKPGKTKEGEYRPVFLSSNAITLSNGIQLITRFFGDAETIHENFDFVHCMNYWTSWDRKLILRPDALEAIITRQLIYNGSKYPICSIIRTRKFIQRGWNCNAGQYFKMCMQVSKLNLMDTTVLQEQLLGVDVMYFAELIRILNKTNPKDITDAYIIELIDKIF